MARKEAEVVAGVATELTRANKVTAYWGGEGVAIGVFSKTHSKLVTVKSNDDAVVNAGFKFAEEATAQEKLESFKTFLMTNSSSFGISYDPVDRRADEFKYPSKYDEDTMKEYSKTILESTVGAALDKVQNNVIASMVKAGHLAEGTTVQFGIGEVEINVAEKYPSEAIKYGTAKYPVVIAVGESKVETECTVELVSGQLKKPRELQNTVLTMTGIKGMLIEAGVLPKIEKKEKSADVEDAGEVPTAPDAE